MNVQDAAGDDDVARSQHVADVGWLQAIARQFLLRVIKVNGLGQGPYAVDLGNQRNALQMALDKIGIVVQLAIGKLVACTLGQLRKGFLGIADDDRTPNVGVQFGKAKMRLGELLKRLAQSCIVMLGKQINSNESWSL